MTNPGAESSESVPGDEFARADAARCDGGSESATRNGTTRSTVTYGDPGDNLPTGRSQSTVDPEEWTTVLHVDDDLAVRELVAEFLTHTGDDVTVLTETNASDALGRVADAAVDCVVSDLEMPGMDGLEFARALESSHADVPVLLFTSRPREDIAGENGAEPLDGYVRKGGNPQQLEALARRVQSIVS